ncbi:MAG TPA: carboxypeptidase-like regulatory domain-containing protein [Gemmatimonadaceae bacterium]|nr:carboxypeptidase-like regulatory domain-containing protein [Gemmatimonadaceae bacterium]
MSLRPILLAAAIAVVAAPLLPAQKGVVVGFAHDSAGGPIPDASVVVADQRTRADSTGRFVVNGVKPGFREVHVRRIGYMPYDATLRLKADGSDTVRAELLLSPRRMPTIVTRATKQCKRYEYEGLMCRRADGRGIVYTIDEIDEEQPEFLADLFEGTRGVRVDLAISHYGQLRVPRAVGRCMVQLINGLHPLPGWTPWARTSVVDVAGLEVYQPSEVPPEYRFEAHRGERCWLINVWTWDKLDS